MAKWLILTGVCFMILGLVWFALEKTGLFHLPGDLHWQGRHWQVFIPLTTCLLLSVLLTILIWLFGMFFK